MIKPQFDHIGLNVIDLDTSLAFYPNLFGFAVIARWDEPKQAFIGAAVKLFCSATRQGIFWKFAIRPLWNGKPL